MHGERLDYTIHPADTQSRDFAVIGHGVTGDKDRPLVIALAKGLAAAGIPALRFSFSGNGGSEGSFAESTLTKEVEDLGAVLDALAAYSITYAGHSMGGAIGVMRAAKDQRIRRLVSLAGMVHTGAFAEREFGMEPPGEGFMWEERDFPLSRKFMDEMKATNSVVDLAGRIDVPWLLVHGTDDDIVPIGDSRDIMEKRPEGVELVELADADHVFSGESTSAMVANVVEWIRRQKYS